MFPLIVKQSYWEMDARLISTTRHTSEYLSCSQLLKWDRLQPTPGHLSYIELKYAIVLLLLPSPTNVDGMLQEGNYPGYKEDQAF